MDLHPMKDMWKCVTIIDGVESVITFGTILMLK